MSDIKIEPFTAKVYFQLRALAENDVWQEILAGYMDTIAMQCDKTGKCLIGHIKGLTLGPDKSYLQVSVISPSHPADFNGSLAQGMSTLMLTLNVLVYGLSRDSLERIVQEVSTDSVQGLVASIKVVPVQVKSEHKDHPHAKQILPVIPE
jgi:hypothetical protein